MAWLEFTIPTAGRSTEDVACALTSGGFAELVVDDGAQYEEFLQQNRDCWDYIDESLSQKLEGLARIQLYLDSSDAAGRDRLQQLVKALGLTMSSRVLPDTDWSESWKENYPAVEVGSSLIVLPYWLSEDSRGRKPVILDPGLTFGTGAHPSTQMVMEFMEEQMAPGASCLDLGSGSGILSITALRLGAKSAIGIDIDPKAENIARENAAFNGFSAPEFTALTGNVISDKSLMSRLQQQTYDFVLVNIVADVIIGLAPVLPRLLSEGSTLLCSGILNTRLDDVVAALEKEGIEIRAIRAKEDWRSISAGRRH